VFYLYLYNEFPPRDCATYTCLTVSEFISRQITSVPIPSDTASRNSHVFICTRQSLHSSEALQYSEACRYMCRMCNTRHFDGGGETHVS